jgi:hypothetical protein
VRKVLALRLSAPPNGGPVGWGVIAATFLVFAVVVGLETCYGILYASLLADPDLVGADRASLAWVQSIAVFLELALGVAVGAFVDKVGARTVCVLGGALTCAGLFLSSLATRVEALFLTYSVVLGVGLALAYGSASIAIGQYFTTRGAFANAIAGIGTGVGTIVLSAVMQVLLEVADWRACMRVLGLGGGAAVALAGLAFIPIDAPPPQTQPKQLEEGSGLAAQEATKEGGHAAAAAGGQQGGPAGAGAGVVSAPRIPPRAASTSTSTSTASSSPLTALRVLSGSAAGGANPRPRRVVSHLALAAMHASATAAEAARAAATTGTAADGDGEGLDDAPHTPLVTAASAGPAPSSSSTATTIIGRQMSAMSPLAGPAADAGGGLPASTSTAATTTTPSSSSSPSPAAGTPRQAALGAASLYRGSGAFGTPLSPFLIPGGHASAASFVHQSSLRPPALATLLREVSAIQQQRARSGTGGGGSSTPLQMGAAAASMPEADSSGAASATAAAMRQRGSSIARASPMLLAAPGSGRPPTLGLRRPPTNSSLTGDAPSPIPGTPLPPSAMGAGAGAAQQQQRGESVGPASSDSPASFSSGTPTHPPSSSSSLSAGPVTTTLGPSRLASSSSSSASSSSSSRSAAFGSAAGYVAGGGIGGINVRAAAQLVDVDDDDDDDEDEKGDAEEGEEGGEEAAASAPESGAAAAAAAAAFEWPTDDDIAAQQHAALHDTTPARPPSAGFGALLHRLRLLPSRHHAQTSALNVWADKRFWGIALAMALVVANMSVPETHLGAFVEDVGLPPELASRLYSAMGLAGIVGRLFFGTLTYFYDVDLLLLVQICGVATGLSVAGLGLYGRSELYLYSHAIVLGGLGTAIFGFISPVLAGIFGIPGLPYALGGTYTVRAPVVLLAAPLAGWAREELGDYQDVWAVCGCLLLLSALPIALMRTECRRVR